MTLCSNRPEGFGPSSHLYHHILTSCFLDTVLVPLCTWLYFFTLLALLLLSRRKSSAKETDHQIPVAQDAETKLSASTSHQSGSNVTRKPRFRKRTILVLQIIYTLLLVAQILMCILEITRLSLAKLGIGLLPFTIVGIIVAGALHWFLRGGLRMRVRFANIGFWVALGVVDIVKIAGEVKEGTGGRKGSKYPISDEITDVSVMVGVYAVLAVLENIG